MTAPYCPRPSLANYYLGKPGTMLPLPMVDAGRTSTADRAAVKHSLLSGGTTVTRRSTAAKRAWVLGYSQQVPEDADLLLAFYTGVMGVGPFALIDPTFRNHADADSSVMGRRLGTAAWVASVGTAAYDGTLSPPAAAARSGVLRWIGAGAGSLLYAGQLLAGNPSALPLLSVPLLPGVPTVLSLYAATASGTASVALSALASTGDGTASSSLAATGTIGLTTAYQRIQIAFTPTSPVPKPYLLPSLACSTAGAPNILIAGLQIEFGLSAASPFVVGLGAPRVSIGPDTLPLDSSVYWRRSSQLALVEN